MTSCLTGRHGFLADNADEGVVSVAVVVGGDNVDGRGTVDKTRKASWDEENALRAWVKNWRVFLVDIGESGILELVLVCEMSEVG